MDPLRQLHQQGCGNRWLPGRLGDLVLGLDGLADTGNTIAKEELGEELLFLG